MTKYILSFVTSFLSLAIFFSCEKDDNTKDKSAPEILDIKINRNDTVRYNGITYTINLDKFRDENNALPDSIIPDTIVTGRKIKFSARFKDDRGLSTYTIRMYFSDTILSNKDENKNFTSCRMLSYHDPKTGEQKDTALCVIDTWSSRIFGQTDVLEVQSDIVVRSTYSKSVELDDKSHQTKDLPVKRGFYNFDIHCIDKSGKETVVRRKVYIVPKDIFISERKI